MTLYHEKFLNLNYCITPCMTAVWWLTLNTSMERRLFRYSHETCVSFNRGTAEKLHLNGFDDDAVYSTLFVAGQQGRGWDRSDSQGNLELSLLGVSIPILLVDVLYFQAGVQPPFGQGAQRVRCR